MANISFTVCKKALPASTPIKFNIPEGFRPLHMITRMVTIGEAKLSTYFSAEVSGNTSITIYNGLTEGARTYAEIFYFAKL